MAALKAFILDDDLYGRKVLGSILGFYCPEVNVVGKCGRPAEAKKLINELRPDVLFLDICMPGQTGFEFLENFSERNFLVVFVTAHPEFAIQAFKADAVDYLLKPIDISELQNTVKKLVSLKKKSVPEEVNQKKTHAITLHSPNGLIIIKVDEITRLEGLNNYTKVYLSDKKTITVSKTLKEFENVLPKNNFIRVHKSDILNIDYIDICTHTDGGYAVLKDQTKIRLARRRINGIFAKVKEQSQA